MGASLCRSLRQEAEICNVTSSFPAIDPMQGLTGDTASLQVNLS